MSLYTSRVFLAGLFAVATGCFLCQSAQSQDKPDILDEAKQRVQVEIQKVEKDVQSVKADARQLAVKEPAKAVAVLRSCREGVATNPDLPDDKRKALLRGLDLAIGACNDRIADLAKQQVPPPPSRTGDKKPMDDTNRGTFDRAKDLQARTKGAKDADAELKAQREGNLLRVLEDVDKTSIPQVKDITFPADWAAKSEKRLGMNLTKEERKIMEALVTVMDIDLKDPTLEDVISYLKDKTGVQIIVPPNILEDKMITYKAPVTVDFKGRVTMRSILKKALSDVGLVYIVKDNVIQVTTEERAKQTLTTRTYYMGDLLLLTDVRMPRYAQQAQAIQTINEVINVITSSIEPNSWWVNGGPGRIVFDPRTMSLVVTQTAEVHYMMNFKR